MGEGIKGLEQAVTAAEIAHAFFGRAIGHKAYRKPKQDGGFFYLIHGAWYEDESGDLGANNLTFGFEEGKHSLIIRKKLGYKDLEDEVIHFDDFEKYCSMERLEQHEEIMIFYAFQQPDSAAQMADISFAGAYVPGTDVGMAVRGVDFPKRNIYIAKIKDRVSTAGKTPVETILSTPHTPDSDSVPIAEIIRGYASRRAREDKEEYNRHQATVRYYLKQGGVYKEMEKKGKSLFFRKELLSQVHKILQEAGFGWYDADSPYDPSKDGEERPEDTDEPGTVTADTSAALPDSKTLEVTKAKAIPDSALEAEINKALARGDVKLGTAVYRIIPAEYGSRGERIKGIAEEWRDGIRDYALNNPLVSGCMYLLDGSEDCYFIRREKMREFYQ